MFRQILAVLFIVFLGGAAFGAPIKVKSGEHGGFTRLVLEGPNVLSWEYETSGQENRIKILHHTAGFETDSVYRFINKNRVRSIASNPSEFRFVIGCDCAVEIFAIGDNVLVVDVKGSDKPIAAPYNTASSLSIVEARTEPLIFGTLGPDPSEGGILGSTSQNLPQNTSQLPMKMKSEKPSRRSSQVDLNTFVAPKRDRTMHINSEMVQRPPTQDETDALRMAQNQLLREIGSASTRGVLDANVYFDLPLREQTRPQVDLRIFDSSHTQTTQQQELPQASQIRITSSTDILVPGKQNVQVTTLGIACIEPQRVDVASWSDGRSFESQVGDFRRNLYGEFDHLNSDTALQLARLYIYFGFGAEARGTLLLIERGSDQWPELLDMAEILEFGFASNSRVLHHFSDCDSVAALWGIVASKELQESQTVNERVALLTINSLPIHLRKILAPELSERLLNYGDQTGAKNAMRNLERLSEQADNRAVFANAELEVAKGDLDAAGALLNDVVESNSEFSARALISLIQTEMELGHDIDVETAQLVDAYSLELRDAPIGAELRHVHVLALAKSNQFHQAFTALGDLDNDADSRALRSKLVQLLTEDASDSVFLELVYSQMPKLAGIQNKEHIFTAAQRLQRLGFSKTAEQLLHDGEVDQTGRKQKVLRAQIALDLKRPAAAEAYLVQLDGEDINLLRARAKEQIQDRKTAHDIYAQLEQQDDARNNAWLSNQWQTLIDPDAPVFGQLVSIANHRLEQSAESEGMLLRSQNLLAESSDTRIFIETVLQNKTDLEIDQPDSK